MSWLLAATVVISATQRAAASDCLPVDHPSFVDAYSTAAGSATNGPGAPLELVWDTDCATNRGYLIYRFDDRISLECALREGISDTPPLTTIYGCNTNSYIDRDVPAGADPTYLIRGWRGQTGCRGGWEDLSETPRSIVTYCTTTIGAGGPILEVAPPPGQPVCRWVRAHRKKQIGNEIVDTPCLGTVLWTLNLEPLPETGNPIGATRPGTYRATCLETEIVGQEEQRCAFATTPYVLQGLPLPIIRVFDGPCSTLESCLPYERFENPYYACAESDFSITYPQVYARVPSDDVEFVYRLLRNGNLVSQTTPAIDHFFPINASGVYTVEAIDPNGCITKALQTREIIIQRAPRMRLDVERISCDRVVVRANPTIIEPDEFFLARSPGRYASGLVPVYGNEAATRNQTELTLMYDPDHPATHVESGYFAYISRKFDSSNKLMCENAGPMTFIELSKPQATITNTRGGLACSSLTLSTESGQRDYRWYKTSDDGSALEQILTNAGSTLSVSESGAYSVSWQDRYGCQTFSVPFTASIVGLPAPTTDQHDIVNFLESQCNNSHPCVDPEISIPFSSISSDARADLRVTFELLEDYQIAGQVPTISKRLAAGEIQLLGSCSGCDKIKVNRPDFGRPIIARILIRQSDCEPVLVRHLDGRPMLYAAVGENEIVALPRTGTSYGGTPVRLFGKGLAPSGSAAVTFASSYNAEILDRSIPDQWLVKTHASPSGSVSIQVASGVTRQTPPMTRYGFDYRYRYATFGIVSIPTVDDTNTSEPGAYLFDADRFALVDSDAYEPGVNPVFTSQDVDSGLRPPIGLAGMSFGKADSLIGGRSWVYVANPARLHRFDTGSFEKDGVFGEPTSGPVCPSCTSESDLEDLNGDQQSLAAGGGIICPPQIFCFNRLPPDTSSYLFRDVTTDEHGRVFALVGQTEVFFPTACCPFVVRSETVQLWSESTPLSEPGTVFSFGRDDLADYDRVWANEKSARAAISMIDDVNSNVPPKIGVQLFDTTSVGSIGSVSALGFVGRTVLAGQDAYWPASHLATVPASGAGCTSTYLAEYDGVDRSVRQIDVLTGAFRTGPLADPDRYNLLGVGLPFDVGLSRKPNTSGTTTVGNKDGIIAVAVLGDDSISNEGRLRVYELDTCGAQLTGTDRRGQVARIGSSDIRTTAIALRSDGQIGFASARDSSELISFGPRSCLGFGGNCDMTPPPGATGNGRLALPGRPGRIVLQRVLDETLATTAVAEAVESWPASYFEDANSATEILEQTADFVAASEQPGAKANQALGMAYRLRQTLIREITNQESKTLVVDLMTAAIEILQQQASQNDDGQTTDAEKGQDQ